MSTLNDVIASLQVAGEEVDGMVSDLPVEDWSRSTPAPGWTVAHQIAHLAATFRLAGLAAGEPAAFTELASGLGPDFNANVDRAMAPYLAAPPDVLLEHWRTERAVAIKALSVLDPGQLVPWLVNPLPPAVLASAGMMELFGHGQDIADALGISRTPTYQLEHLVTFAVRTRDFGYLARGLEPPREEFRFDITGPSGTRWEHGPAGAVNRITGPVVDFCLLVSRRRHPQDLAVEATGPLARQWLMLAQAYRGPAGADRAPGQFATASR